uniref:Uncharacterized protein n=1 Tax=Heterorhabditis bacteriophora TaxID=37862 RepID=A0A1I7X6G9_HETBA
MYFHRQRFVSECPILDDCEVEGLQTRVSQKALKQDPCSTGFFSIPNKLILIMYFLV